MWPFNRAEPVEPVAESRIPKVKRSYAGASTNIRYTDFSQSPLSANAELQVAITSLRNRARNLGRNNPHVKRYIQLMQDNVAGENGFALQIRAKNSDGTFDDYGNRSLETAWSNWCQNVTTDGQMTMREAARMAVRTFARDGEVIAKIVRKSNYTHAFAIKFIESDMLDETLNTNVLSNGNRIRMGVEIDEDDAPVAYWFLTDHPGDMVWGVTPGMRKHVRIDASEIIHVFIKDRAGQTRGEPPLSSVMLSLKMLDGYREAEITNRRVAASKMGFFTRDGKAGDVAGVANEIEDDGTLIDKVEPGTFSALPVGYDFKAFDISGSATDYEAFEKQVIKSIAAGLSISYADLASDLTEVSYSSIRQGALTDRAFYRALQRFFIDRFQLPVFKNWLRMYLDFYSEDIPAYRYDKFQSASIFRGRGWTWIDPSVEIESAINSIGAGLSTRSQFLAESGLDFYDVIDDAVEEQKYMTAKGFEGGNPKEKKPDNPK